MYSNKFNFKNKEIYIEKFNNVFEWVNTIESRKLNSWNVREYDNEKEDINEEWYGCKTYQEAKSFLIQGIKWINYNNIVFNYTNNFKPSKGKSVKNVIGSQVSIPRFLHNHPKAMIRRVNMKKKTKKLDIVIDPTFSTNIEANSIWRIAFNLFDFFKILNENNYIYNISLLYTFIHPYNKYGYNCLINVKASNEPLNNNIISSCIGLPSTFRKISFRWYESYPGAKKVLGYGRPISLFLTEEEIELFCDKIGFNAKHIFFIELQDLYERFDGIFKAEDLLKYYETKHRIKEENEK